MADVNYLENQKIVIVQYRLADFAEINRDISETVWPILTKFCKMAHISSSELTSC